MESYKSLATAIILQALKDAQKGNQDALQWILGAGPGFSFWCRFLGMEADLARDCLEKEIETASPSKEQRRELILKALQEHPELSNREIGRRLKVNYETVRGLRMKLAGVEGRGKVNYQDFLSNR